MRTAAFRERSPIPWARSATRSCRPWTLHRPGRGDGGIGSEPLLRLLPSKSDIRATTRQYSTSATPHRVSPAQDQDTLSTPSDFQPSTSATATAIAGTNPTLPPINPSAAHHSLATFLTHAQRTGLSTSSTVYNGTVYEYLTQETLRGHGFELHRMGGRGDRGVDLVGLWRIPRGRQETASEVDGERDSRGGRHDLVVLRVLVQCKRLVGKHAKIGPNLIRELDGAVRGARLGFLFDSIVPRATDSGDGGGMATTATGKDPSIALDDAETTNNSYYSTTPAIGVLVGTRPATKGVIDTLRRSNRGLVWIMLEEVTGTGNSTSGVHSDADSESQPPRTTAEAGQEEDEARNTEPRAEFPSTRPSPPTGRIRQIIWNQAARNLGLEGVDVVKRYVSASPPRAIDRDSAGRVDTERGDDAERGEEEVVLCRAGRPLYPVSSCG